MPEVKDLLVLQSFESKQNSVYLTRPKEEGNSTLYLSKKFLPPYIFDKMIREKQLLQGLIQEGVSVARFITVKEGSILLEYIDGSLLIDIISEQEIIAGPDSSCITLPVYQIINSLSAWLKDFYTATNKIAGKQLILGDISFRNFIVREKLYGINFQECREGHIEEDVARLCAFALTYKPAFTTWKLTMVTEMLKTLIGDLSLNSELTKKYLKKELLTLIPCGKVFSHKYVGLLLDNLLQRILFVNT